MILPWLEPDCRRIEAAIDAERLGHAPLLLGSSGVGKRALAEWLARRLLCAEPGPEGACGRCKSCRLIESGTHPDFFRVGVLEDKTEILVDQVREFIESITLTPALGDRRVGLIDPADRLNENAANALLKTLEEPAGNVWIVLVTEREDRLPVTIRSRCQRLYVPVPDRRAALDWLSARHDDHDAAELDLALDLADGAPLLAHRWLEDEGLERGTAVRDALLACGRPDFDEAGVIAAWKERPAEAWDWLARWSEAFLRQALSGEARGLPERPGPVPSPETLESCWADALEGKRLAWRPVRHDWLMRRWLARWRAGTNGIMIE
ncbi:MAG: DNA polymerase III subunit delta' [Wenzhouxiangellaceae bacterium]|nr:DNA polymerase III subunit delta' [Wenzhouxiangellaceae bacterium]